MFRSGSYQALAGDSTDEEEVEGGVGLDLEMVGVETLAPTHR